MSASTTPPAQDPGQLILIDKPLTWTSFDVVNKLKYACKFKKIGHAGTLDPLATGLLILCTGKMTKQIDQYQAQEKEYTGTLVLGKTTPSVDLETEFVILEDTSGIIDHRLGEVVLGKSFLDKSEASISEDSEMIAFEKGNRKVTFLMPHKSKRYTSSLHDE